MEKIRVLVTVNLPAMMIQKLAEISPRLEVIQHEARTPEEVRPHLQGVEVLYTWRAIPRPEEAPDLRWVQLHSAGADDIISTPLYQQTEVRFTTVSGIHAVTMAEYVLAQMLAFAHHLPHMLEDKAARSWPQNRWERYLPHELRESTLGIVGYGSIGREVARLGAAFGMQVLAVKRSIRELADSSYILPGVGDPEGDIPDRFYPPEALHSFLGACDYVVLTVPLTPATHHLIDGPALAAMKKTAVLINVARGPVVDEQALVEALVAGQIRGAALDVFEVEPLPEDSPLWQAPNLIISPHISGFSSRYNERAADVFATNLARYVAGDPLLNQVDRERGY